MNQEDLIRFDSPTKNGTFTFNTSVFGDSKSQLVSENYTEHEQLHVDDLKPHSAIDSTKQRYNSTDVVNTDVDNLDTVRKMRKKFEEYIGINKNY